MATLPFSSPPFSDPPSVRRTVQWKSKTQNKEMKEIKNTLKLLALFPVQQILCVQLIYRMDYH